MALFTKIDVPISQTGLFSKLFLDYLNQHEPLHSFYDAHIQLQDIERYLQSHSFSYIDRATLVKVLKQQAHLVKNTSQPSLTNIELLSNSQTYTVTTGHQLCLFTGPLYFIYKIVSTINLCKTLHQKFPNKNFVPVYWMASEDHDSEEINHAHVFGKKLVWNTEQKGSVGSFDTKTLAPVIEELKILLGDSEQAKHLIHVFETAYLSHQQLSHATRYLVNELFGKYGLVILDGDDATLKQCFTNEFKKDVFENLAFHKVSESAKELELAYHAQVTPRAINVFYKENDIRERIEKHNQHFLVLNTDLQFTESEMLNLIESTPEKLSPNVVLRPLYQQKILPNIAYVGGPGELAYWLEYKKMFDAFQIHFPILMPRNFVAIVDANSKAKWQKLEFDLKDFFKNTDELINVFIQKHFKDINLADIKQQLNDLYSQAHQVVDGIDKTLTNSVEAEKQKALNGIASLEQKINKALKQKSDTSVQQIKGVKEKLFPNSLPQERYDNVSMYIAKYGDSFMEEIFRHLQYNLSDFSYTLLLAL